MARPIKTWHLATAVAVALLLSVPVAVYILAPKDAERAGTAAAVPIGGTFRLTTQNGTALSDTDLRGKPFAIFFGFTHCPEVCPTTLYEMAKALETLGPDADRVRVLFVSVDPERDTPQVLKSYLESFDPRIIGLTGTDQEVEAMTKAYRVYRQKVALDDGSYTMDHTAFVYLMDETGKFVDVVAYQEPVEVLVTKLRRLIGRNAA